MTINSGKNQMLDNAAREETLDGTTWYAWEIEENDGGWLLTYVDVLSVILAMLVVLLGQMAVQHLQTTNEDNRMAASYEAVPSDEPTVEVQQPQPLIQTDAESKQTIDAETRLVAAIEDRFQDEVKVVQRDKGISLEIADVILFDSGKAELLAAAQPVLKRLAVTLQEIGKADIAVEGHTDDRPILGGRFQSNWELAAARANAVTRFLLDQGFAPKHLRSISYADAHPVADNSNPNGRAENRRVNLRVEFLQ
ncbi:MAG: flagellar motor protein MotB [Candidatus Thiodiazotropha endolucinida]